MAKSDNVRSIYNAIGNYREDIVEVADELNTLRVEMGDGLKGQAALNTFQTLENLARRLNQATSTINSQRGDLKDLEDKFEEEEERKRREKEKREKEKKGKRKKEKEIASK